MSSTYTRTGAIARKVGMTRVFDLEGKHVPVTVLHLEDVQVVQQKTVEKEGYAALQLGLGNKKPSRVSKPLLGHFKKQGVEPKYTLREFRIDPKNTLDVGTALTAEHFTEGQFVDVAGITIGRGFAGVMKRHNFRGLEASHGVSISHRSHGSTGQRQDPGRVFKGKKMAGHMGQRRRTQLSLKVIKIDAAHNVLFVKGSIPGADGSVVEVRDAVKKPAKKN